jgi:PAS domain-containing protein
VPVVAAAEGRLPVGHLVGVPFVHPGSPTERCLQTGEVVIADGDEGTRPGREQRRREMGIAGLGLQSVAVLPLLRGGRVVGALNLSIDQPVFFRNEAEMALVKEMAGDISFALDFLAAEALLREEWVMFKAVMDGMSEGVYIVNRECDIIYVNPPVVSEFGTPGDRKCYNYFHDRDDVCPWCKNEQVFNGEIVEWKWTSPKSGKLYCLRDQPLHRADGSVVKIEFFHDITELDRLRKATAEVHRHSAQAD